MKITEAQREKWISENKCHICGSGEDRHTHPNWMWLAHPAPGKSERAKIENQINKKVLERILK